jgi:hypothetical protein
VGFSTVKEVEMVVVEMVVLKMVVLKMVVVETVTYLRSLVNSQHYF